MNWRELAQKRAELVKQARAMLDGAGADGLTAEQRTAYDALLVKIDNATADEKRAQKLDGYTVSAEGRMVPPSAEIGMSGEEIKRYSLVRAIRAAADLRTGNAGAAQEATLEMEASRAVAKKVGREPRGFFVPQDWANAPLERPSLRGWTGEARAGLMTVGTPTDGGNLVATDLLASSFIELLRNKMVVRAAGATVLAGLVGNIAIPRQTGATTAYWVAEESAVTTSKLAIDQVTMSPKMVGTYTDISRSLLLQSSLDVEGLVRSDIATVLAMAIDKAGFHRDGSTLDPTGVAGTTGIGSVAGGDNGAAPTWANIVALETEVSVDNADIGRLAYITNTKVRGKLKGTPKVAGQAIFVWGDGAQPLNGYNAFVTNQVSSTLTKGGSGAVCSAIFFGNWADLVIGLWGGLDILVDPYTNATKGTVRVVALQDADICVRHAESFAAMLDALTT